MKRGGTRMALVALALFLSGCNDFSQHRFGGVRNNFNEGPPKLAPQLAITNPPHDTRPGVDLGLKPATFVPPRESVGPSDTPLLQHPMRLLYQRAAQRYATMDAYMYRFTRREAIGGVLQPRELMLVKVRHEPFSVYMKWLDDASKGRELIYVRGKYDNKMQVLLAAGDVFPLPAGIKMSFAPDDPTVKAKSRYPITETGLGAVIERYGRMVAGIEKGERSEGTAKYLGQVKRDEEEFKQKLECVYQVLPAESDPNFPKGGERWWFFDPTHGLPVLIVARDGTGEVEYYRHDHIQSVRLDGDDFNPDRLWRK